MVGNNWAIEQLSNNWAGSRRENQNLGMGGGKLFTGLGQSRIWSEGDFILYKTANDPRWGVGGEEEKKGPRDVKRLSPSLTSLPNEFWGMAKVERGEAHVETQRGPVGTVDLSWRLPNEFFDASSSDEKENCECEKVKWKSGNRKMKCSAKWILRNGKIVK